MPSRRQRRSDGMLRRKSLAKAHEIVSDVSDEKIPPDDEPQEGRQNSARPYLGVCPRPTPANPIGREQCQTDRTEMLFDVEEAERRPVAVALKCGLNVDAEVPVDDGSQCKSGHVQKDNGVGERGG